MGRIKNRYRFLYIYCFKRFTKIKKQDKKPLKTYFFKYKKRLEKQLLYMIQLSSCHKITSFTSKSFIAFDDEFKSHTDVCTCLLLPSMMMSNHIRMYVLICVYKYIHPYVYMYVSCVYIVYVCVCVIIMCVCVCLCVCIYI